MPDRCHEGWLTRTSRETIDGMATLIGTVLNADKVSVGKGDRDTHLTLLDLQPFGVPLRLGHCDCEGCQVGEIVDVALTADGRSWCVALTDLPRERCEGYVFSLGGTVVDGEPADLVTPRLTVLREVSLVERSGSCTTPVRWQPTTLRAWDRGGYATGTTAPERQVLDHAAGRLDFQRRAGVIEVVTLPARTPATVTPVVGRTRVADPGGGVGQMHTRYFASARLR